MWDKRVTCVLNDVLMCDELDLDFEIVILDKFLDLEKAPERECAS